MTSLVRVPSKQHASLDGVSGQQMGASIPLGRKSPAAIICHLFLVALVVIQGADQAAPLSSSISPDVMGLSFSVCRAVKWFGKGTSHFGGSVFLLLVLAIASFHSSVLLAPLPSVCASGGVFGCLAVGPLQTGLGTSYLTPSFIFLISSIFL